MAEGIPVPFEMTHEELVAYRATFDLGEVIEIKKQSIGDLSQEPSVTETQAAESLYVATRQHPTDYCKVKLLTHGNAVLTNVALLDEYDCRVLEVGTVVLVGYLGTKRLPFVFKSITTQVALPETMASVGIDAREGAIRPWQNKFAATEIPTMSPDERFIYSVHGNSLYLRKDGALLLRGGFHYQNTNATGNDDKSVVASSYFVILGGLQGIVPTTEKRAVVTIGTEELGPAFYVDESGSVSVNGTNQAVLTGILTQVFGSSEVKIQAGGWAGTPTNPPTVSKGFGLLTVVVGRDNAILIGRDKTEHVRRNETRFVDGNVVETIIGKETRTIGGDVSETITGREEITIGGPLHVTVQGSGAVVDIQGDAQVNVNGNLDAVVATDLNARVGRNAVLDVAGNIDVGTGGSGIVRDNDLLTKVICPLTKLGHAMPPVGKGPEQNSSTTVKAKR